MKKLFNLAIIVAVLMSVSCKKENKDDAVLLQNAWSVKFNGHTTVYNSKTVTLNTQSYGVLKSISNDRAAGGYGGISSTIVYYFKSIPLSDKTYKITTLSRIATHDDEVAVEVIVWGDPDMGLSQMLWASEGDGSQTLNYKFANSKGSGSFDNLALYNGTAQVKQSIVVSGNINQ